MDRFLRLADASRASGVSKYELMEIARTPGQTAIRKLSPTKKTSPWIVDMTQLDDYLRARAQASVPRPTRRTL